MTQRPRVALVSPLPLARRLHATTGFQSRYEALVEVLAAECELMVVDLVPPGRPAEWAGHASLVTSDARTARIDLPPPVRARTRRLARATADIVGIRPLEPWERELRELITGFAPRIVVVVPYRSWDGMAALSGSRTLYFAEEDPDKQLTQPRPRRGRAIERYSRFATRRGNRGPSVAAVISEREREWAERAFPSSAVVTIPHTIDLDYWDHRSATTDSDSPIDALSVGLLDHPRNADGLRAVVDELVERSPDATPRVVAASGTPPMQGLLDGREAVLEVIEGADDVRPLYRKARVALVPSFVVPGVKTTILQAFAMGVPVVTTSAAADSLGLVDGHEALVGSTPPEVVEQLLRALATDELTSSLALAGTEFVNRNHDRRAFTTALWSALELAASGTPTGGRRPRRRFLSG